MPDQLTDTILMIRPAAFGFNPQTASSNHFQKESAGNEDLQKHVLKEFDAMVELLKSKGVRVIVFEDTIHPVKPDAIFPNNWLSTTADGIIHVFPMYASNRREEKRDDILHSLTNEFLVRDVLDWTEYEAENMFLEGTGSMVMDHQNRIIYACLSDRTHKAMVEKFAGTNGYKAIVFNAHDINDHPIYHTNVMMCIGEGFAVLCPKTITDDTERVAVSQLLETTGHENIYITHEQMNAFAGNMLHVKTTTGKRMIVLSRTAHEALTLNQLERLNNYGELLPINVSTIEQEGGSVRCMMAEIFLPRKSKEQL